MTRGRRLGALAALTAGLWAGCTIESHEEPTDQAPPPAPERIEVIELPGGSPLPVFSSAVRAGGFLFLSGSIGVVPGGELALVEGGVEAETRQTLANIAEVLAAAGATLDDIVKCTVFLADMTYYAAMNAVYQEVMPSPPPARSAVAGSGLALGALVEIECLALDPEGGAS